MKLTEITDGRWLLEIGDDTLVLSGFEITQLADLIDTVFYGVDPFARRVRIELADLRQELAEYKATRATGGPWRPADQTWVSADIEPPASASDDTAPPLFRGLTVDKKETA